MSLRYVDPSKRFDTDFTHDYNPRNEEIRKAQGNEQIGDNKSISRPNINPSNVYNF